MANLYDLGTCYRFRNLVSARHLGRPCGSLRNKSTGTEAQRSPRRQGSPQPRRPVGPSVSGRLASDLSLDTPGGRATPPPLHPVGPLADGRVFRAAHGPLQSCAACGAWLGRCAGRGPGAIARHCGQDPGKKSARSSTRMETSARKASGDHVRCQRAHMHSDGRAMSTIIHWTLIARLRRSVALRRRAAREASWPPPPRCPARWSEVATAGRSERRRWLGRQRAMDTHAT